MWGKHIPLVKSQAGRGNKRPAKLRQGATSPTDIGYSLRKACRNLKRLKQHSPSLCLRKGDWPRSDFDWRLIKKIFYTQPPLNTKFNFHDAYSHLLKRTIVSEFKTPRQNWGQNYKRTPSACCQAFDQDF